MAKYYIASGDLETIVSTSMTPKMACKVAIEKFIQDNTDNKDKSVTQSIGISQKGFRKPDSKLSHEFDDALFFDVCDLVES